MTKNGLLARLWEVGFLLAFGPLVAPFFHLYIFLVCWEALLVDEKAEGLKQSQHVHTCGDEYWGDIAAPGYEQPALSEWKYTGRIWISTPTLFHADERDTDLLLWNGHQLPSTESARPAVGYGFSLHVDDATGRFDDDRRWTIGGLGHKDIKWVHIRTHAVWSFKAEWAVSLCGCHILPSSYDHTPPHPPESLHRSMPG